MIELVHFANKLIIIFNSLLLLAKFIEFFFIDLHVILLTWYNNQHVFSLVYRSSLTLILNFCLSRSFWSIYRFICTFKDKILHLKLSTIHFNTALLLAWPFSKVTFSASSSIIHLFMHSAWQCVIQLWMPRFARSASGFAWASWTWWVHFGFFGRLITWETPSFLWPTLGASPRLLWWLFWPRLWWLPCSRFVGFNCLRSHICFCES